MGIGTIVPTDIIRRKKVDFTEVDHSRLYFKSPYCARHGSW